MTVDELLAKHGIKLESTAPGQYYTTCPRCSHARKKSGDKCLGVKIDDKGVIWHCMHCQWSGPEKGSGKQQARSEQWTILAEYIYRDRDNKPFLRVRKCRDADGNKQYPQYHWDGAAWAKGKPKLNGKAAPKIPYRLPELISAPIAGIVYLTEGEKDADSLARLGFTATTASEGAAAKWDQALTQYFKDRHVVILPDADKPGRAHGIKVAKAINGAAASLRILDLYPERDDGADASDWIAEDTAGAKLVQRTKEAPLWEPPAESGKEEDIAIAFVTGGSETDADAEITRLAKLTWVEYGQQRKGVAQKLGISSVSILDKAVAAERAKLGLDAGDGSKLQGQAISFPEPEPWPKPVNGAELLDAIADAVRRHVVMSDTARDAAALWVAHSYLTECFVVSPRLGVRSPTKQCGKTTLLDLLARLVLRPLSTANCSVAAIFRVIEAHHPTVLMDEADTFLRDNDELRGILNGNRRGSTVLRTVGESFEVRAFATYGAVAIAAIGGLPDTLHDRSVIVDLKRKLASEKVEPFRSDRTDELDVLARKAVRWAADNAEAIATADPATPSGIINREADNWRPLLAIADVAGGQWPERARKAAEAAHLAAADDDASLLELLLADIRDAFTAKGATVRDMFGAEKVEIASADLVDALKAIEGRPWADGMGKNRDKPITQNMLARMLKRLRPPVTPQKVGPEDARVSGYVRSHLEEAFERYLGPEGVSQPDIRTEAHEIRTSEISQPDSPEDACPVADMQEIQQRRDSVRMSSCEGGSEGGKANGSAPGLSPRTIADLAEAYNERAYANAQENEGDTRTAELDAWLRQRLADEMVLPEFTETEFKRVMAEVFRV